VKNQLDSQGLAGRENIALIVARTVDVSDRNETAKDFP
jgi:hypothetical protein